MIRLFLASVYIFIIGIFSCTEELSTSGSCTISEIDGSISVTYCYEYDSPVVSDVPDKLKTQCNNDGGTFNTDGCSINNPSLTCEFDEGVEEGTMYFDSNYDSDDAKEICEDLDGKVK